MKQITLILCVIPFLISLCGKTSDRPNILFVFTDDHAPHAIGAYNGWLKSVNPTPVIDKLAKEGDENFHKFPIAKLDKNSFNFSFSGIKTSLRYFLEKNLNQNQF